MTIHSVQIVALLQDKQLEVKVKLHKTHYYKVLSFHELVLQFDEHTPLIKTEPDKHFVQTEPSG